MNRAISIGMHGCRTHIQRLRHSKGRCTLWCTPVEVESVKRCLSIASTTTTTSAAAAATPPPAFGVNKLIPSACCCQVLFCGTFMTNVDVARQSTHTHIGVNVTAEFDTMAHYSKQTLTSISGHLQFILFVVGLKTKSIN